MPAVVPHVSNWLSRKFHMNSKHCPGCGLYLLDTEPPGRFCGCIRVPSTNPSDPPTWIPQPDIGPSGLQTPIPGITPLNVRRVNAAMALGARTESVMPRATMAVSEMPQMRVFHPGVQGTSRWLADPSAASDAGDKVSLHGQVSLELVRNLLLAAGNSIIASLVASASILLNTAQSVVLGIREEALVILPQIQGTLQHQLGIPFAGWASKFLPHHSSGWEPAAFPLLWSDGSCGHDRHRRYPTRVLDASQSLGWRTVHRTLGFMEYGRRFLNTAQVFRSTVNHLNLLRTRWIIDTFVRYVSQRIDISLQHLNKSNHKWVLGAHEVGSPAWLRSALEDAAFFAAKYPPKLMITFGCNVNWPEIQNGLAENEVWSDRPDLVSRAFHLRLTQFMIDLKRDKRFGRNIKLWGIVEWTEQGSPHAHLVLSSDVEGDLLAWYDDVIRVGFADPRDPLHAIMTHRHTNHCKCDMGCKYEYPQPLVAVTYRDATGKVNHQRSDPNQIPHLRHYPERYNAHIHAVQVTEVDGCLEYLLDYLTKGEKRVSVSTLIASPDKQADVKFYTKGRAWGAGEAAFRLNGFHVLRGLDVTKLDLVLPSDPRPTHLAFHSVAPKPSVVEQWFLRPHDLRDVSLLEFHSSWIVHPFREFRPGDRVLQDPLWVARKRETRRLTRLTTASPDGQIRWIIIELLQQERVAITGNNVRLCWQQLYAAAQQVIRDEEYDGLQVSYFQHQITLGRKPERLRRAFAELLVHGRWHGPERLAQFDANLRGDRITRNRCLAILHNHVRTLGNRSLSDFGIPFDPAAADAECDTLPDHQRTGPELETWIRTQENLMIPEQRTVYLRYMQAMDLEPLLADNVDSANPSAKRRKLDVSPEQTFFILLASGGCGKTFVLLTFLARCRLAGKRVLVSGSTGRAASLLWGLTVHKLFRVPVGEATDILTASTDAGEINSADAILIDEISSLAGNVLLSVHEACARATGRTDAPFGGKLCIASGDMKQISLVLPGWPSERDMYNLSVRGCWFWHLGHVSTLATPMRLYKNKLPSTSALRYKAFFEWCERIGSTTDDVVLPEYMAPILPVETVAHPQNAFPDAPNAAQLVQTAQEYAAIQHAFPELQRPMRDLMLNLRKEKAVGYNTPAWTQLHNILRMADSAIISDTTEVTSRINKLCLRRPANLFGDDGDLEYPTTFLPGKTRLLEPSLNTIFSAKRIQNSAPGSVPLHNLELRPGALAHVTMNYSPPSGLTKHTPVVVIDIIGKHTVRVVRIEDLKQVVRSRGTSVPEIHDLSVVWTEWKIVKNSVPLSRMQFPLQLSYSYTINRAQGLDITRLVCDCRGDPFQHGSQYVKFTRSSDPTQLRVLLHPRNVTYSPHDLLPKYTVKFKNKVYTSLLMTKSEVNI